MQLGIIGQIKDAELRRKWTQLLNRSVTGFDFELGSTMRSFGGIHPGDSAQSWSLKTNALGDVLAGGWIAVIRGGSVGGIGDAMMSIRFDDLMLALERRPSPYLPAMLVVDESLQVVSPSLAEYLPNTTKRGVGCIFALQSATQLTSAGTAGLRLFTEVNLSCNSEITSKSNAAGARHASTDLRSTPDQITRPKRGRHSSEQCRWTM